MNRTRILVATVDYTNIRQDYLLYVLRKMRECDFQRLLNLKHTHVNKTSPVESPFHSQQRPCLIEKFYKSDLYYS